MKHISQASAAGDAPGSTCASASGINPQCPFSDLPDYASSLKKIIDAIPNPVFFREDGRSHMVFNRAFVEAFGASGWKIIDEMTVRPSFAGPSSEMPGSGDGPSGGTGARSREFSFRHTDCTLHYATCNMAPYSPSDGSKAGTVGVISDITAHRRMEEELRRSEERYRTLFEESNDGFFQALVDGTITDVSPAVVSLLGYSSADELKGMNWIDICVDPSERQRFKAELAG
ncbi:MAG: PAS domain S-box protein, partial [Deltaproteobacteria bacterium]